MSYPAAGEYDDDPEKERGSASEPGGGRRHHGGVPLVHPLERFQLKPRHVGTSEEEADQLDLERRVFDVGAGSGHEESGAGYDRQHEGAPCPWGQFAGHAAGRDCERRHAEETKVHHQDRPNDQANRQHVYRFEEREPPGEPDVFGQRSGFQPGQKFGEWHAAVLTRRGNTGNRTQRTGHCGIGTKYSA